jgi:hypothetical protein
MDADEALTEAWLLGEGEEGWSDAVMETAERLLPILIAAGYVEATDAKWNFTAKGVARAMELEGPSLKESTMHHRNSSDLNE